VYNKNRPHRPERRHTTATGISPSRDQDLTRLTATQSNPLRLAHTEVESPPPHDIEQPITLVVPPNSPRPQFSQLTEERGNIKKSRFLFERIFKFKQRRHHPATEQAYKKSLFDNCKTILFSSWVNVLLVFVPVVLVPCYFLMEGYCCACC
jgi:hypothetical protein